MNRPGLPSVAAAVAGALPWALAVGLLGWALRSPSFHPPGVGLAASHPGLYAGMLTLAAWILLLAASLLPAAAPRAWFPSGIRGPAALHAVLALASCLPALAMDFHYDDLYLHRAHSWQGLAAAFTGTWDPNGVLREAYRPLTTAWIMLSHGLFGESAPACRLAAIVLMALAWTMTARRLLGPAAGGGALLLAVLVWFSSNGVCLFAAWVAEGNRALLLLMLASSLVCLDRAGPALRTGWTFAAAGAFALALLVREEAVPMAVWLAGAAVAASWRGRRDGSRPERGLAVAALFLALPLAYLAARRLFLEGSGGEVNPRGAPALGWRVLESYPLSGLGVLALAAAGLALGGPRRPRVAALLGMSALGLLPGVGMDRVDVGILPLTTLSCAAALGAAALVERGAVAARLTRVFLLASLGVGTAVGWVRLDDLRPSSLAEIRRTHEVLRGHVARAGAVVPPARRERFERRQRALGVPDDTPFGTHFNAEMERAESARRFQYAGDGMPFRHAWDFLSSAPSVFRVTRLNATRLAARPAEAAR